VRRWPWDEIAKTYLPIVVTVLGGCWGLWQYVDNSKHNQAATFLTVYEQFGATRQDFESNFHRLAELVSDRGEKSSAAGALGSCKLTKDNDWSTQVACFNGEVTNHRFSSLVMVTEQFVALARYAKSDESAKAMLAIALKGKASLLAANFCNALYSAQDYLNPRDSNPDAHDAVDAVNLFSGGTQCDNARSNIQAWPKPK
jgi:hypothetical protein